MRHLCSSSLPHLVLLVALSLLLASPTWAREKRSAAIAAATAAKNAHSNQGATAARISPAAAPVTRRHFEAEVEMLPGDGTAVLRSEEGPGGGAWRARLDLNTVPLTAQRRRQFGGRRHLLPEDLAPGHRLRVTWLPEDGEILGIRVLKRKRDG